MACRGQAQNGELGYGLNGKKSSANPDKVYALEGVHTHQVACGIGHTLFLVKPGTKQVIALCQPLLPPFGYYLLGSPVTVGQHPTHYFSKEIMHDQYVDLHINSNRVRK